MKVLALTRYGRLGASSRLRTYQYVPYLASVDIHMHVEALLDDDYLTRLYEGEPRNWAAVMRAYLRRVGTLLHARGYDALWVEKELFPKLPAWFEQALAASGVRYAVDYDDAVFHNYDGMRGRRSLVLNKKIDRVMHRASVVVCGSRYLAEHARRCGAQRVELVPTVIDVERYPTTDGSRHQGPVVAWIGTPLNARYLQVAEPALQAVAGRMPLQLRVIGAEFSAAGLDIECRPWSEQSEVSDLSGCSVGIMPLVDSPWERGKCGYKLIQYMACGLPVVASPVGANTDIVDHGRDGFLAATADEWRDAIATLLSDSDLRARMGRAGRRKVEERYCIQVTAPRLAGVLRSTVGTEAGSTQNGSVRA